MDSIVDLSAENANHPVAAAARRLPAYCERPDHSSSGNVSLAFDPTLKTLLEASSLWPAALLLREPFLPTSQPPHNPYQFWSLPALTFWLCVVDVRTR